MFKFFKKKVEKQTQISNNLIDGNWSQYHNNINNIITEINNTEINNTEINDGNWGEYSQMLNRQSVKLEELHKINYIKTNTIFDLSMNIY